MFFYEKQKSNKYLEYFYSNKFLKMMKKCHSAGIFETIPIVFNINKMSWKLLQNVLFLLFYYKSTMFIGVKHLWKICHNTWVSLSYSASASPADCILVSAAGSDSESELLYHIQYYSPQCKKVQPNLLFTCFYILFFSFLVVGNLSQTHC